MDQNRPWIDFNNHVWAFFARVFHTQSILRNSYMAINFSDTSDVAIHECIFRPLCNSYLG